MSKRAIVSIIDDDDSNRQALQGLLRGRTPGGNLRVAEDFSGSRELRTTDCLIPDLRMPGLGGLELQQRLVSTTTGEGS